MTTDTPLHFIRDRWVVLDRTAASQFGVPTKQVNQAVSRHKSRSTDEFAFRLTAEETSNLRSQFVTSNPDLVHKLRKPNVFSEEGIVLLATVLNSDQAVRATKFVIRSFIEVQRARRDRQNSLPVPTVVPATLSDKVPSVFRQRVNAAIKYLSDNALTDAEQASAIVQAKQFKDEGLSALHAWVNRPNLENAERAARIEAELARAQKTQAEAEGIRADNREKERLALIRDLMLLAEMERFSESGDVASFENTLRSFDKG